MPQVADRRCADQRIVLTVHNPSFLEKPQNLPGMAALEQTGIEILVMGPHTAATTRQVQNL